MPLTTPDMGGMSDAVTPALLAIGPKITLDAPQTSIVSQQLNLAASGIYLVRFSLRAAAATSVFIYFNGDTTDANYNRQLLSVTGGSATAFRGNSPGLDTLANADCMEGEMRIVHDQAGIIRARLHWETLTSGIRYVDIAVMKTVAANLMNFQFTATTAAGLSAGSCIKTWQQT